MPLANGESLMASAKQQLTLTLRGEKLDKKDIFGLSDPFIRIHRPTRDGGLIMIHESEVVKKTLDPRWQPMTLALDALNRGDMDVPLLFEGGFGMIDVLTNRPTDPSTSPV